MKHEETYEEMEGNMKRVATRQITEPLSYQFLSRFIHCRIHPRMTVQYALWVNQYIAVNVFRGFLPHIVCYAKFILMAVGGECRSVIDVLSFYGGSAAHTQTLEML